MASITNPSRLYAKLRKIEPSVEKAVRRVLSREANAIVAAMKEEAPFRTGALRASIGWSFGRAPKGRVALGSVRLKSHTTRVTIWAGGPDVDYARIVEFFQKSYFWDTWRAKRKGARNSIIAAAKAGIKEAVR